MRTLLSCEVTDGGVGTCCLRWLSGNQHSLLVGTESLGTPAYPGAPATCQQPRPGHGPLHARPHLRTAGTCRGLLPSTLCAPGSQADTSSLWLCVLPSRLHTASVLSDTDASSICPEPSGVTLRGPRTHTLGNAEAASSYLGPPLSFLGLRTGPWSQGSDTWDPLLGELSPPWPAPGAPTLMAGRVDQRGP